MQYISFDPAREYDLILLGRVAIDFNPVDLNRPLDKADSSIRNGSVTQHQG